MPWTLAQACSTVLVSPPVRSFSSQHNTTRKASGEGWEASRIWLVKASPRRSGGRSEGWGNPVNQETSKAVVTLAATDASHFNQERDGKRSRVSGGGGFPFAGRVSLVLSGLHSADTMHQQRTSGYPAKLSELQDAGPLNALA